MVSYRNDYVPPSSDIPRDIHLNTPLEEYDINYLLDVKELSSDRVQLRPFIPSLHAQLLLEGVQANPEVLRWLGVKPFQDVNDVLVWAESVARRPHDNLTYAIYTDRPGADTPKTDPSEYVFAGVITLLYTNLTHLMIEPGWIVILQPFQRTHVLTHAAGLVMHRILDMPADGGYGMRRCQWTTTSLNLASQNAAKRLGYQYEGVLRAQWICPLGKEGVRPGRKGDRYENQMQRDNWYAAVTFEDWENGVRDHVDKLMARR